MYIIFFKLLYFLSLIDIQFIDKLNYLENIKLKKLKLYIKINNFNIIIKKIYNKLTILTLNKVIS